MKFTQSGGETVRGPEAWFTGDVYIERIGNPDEQTAIGCAHVRFSPGARPPGTVTRRARRCTSPTVLATSPAVVVSFARSAR
jgi:hypothetical protein